MAKNFAQEKLDFKRLSQRVQTPRLNIPDFEDGDAEVTDSTVTHHAGFGIIKHRAQSPIPLKQGPKIRVSF